MKMRSASTFLCIVFLSISLYAQSDSRVQLSFFFSPALNATKFYYVYLPEGYDSSTDHYPVVYFLRLFLKVYQDYGK